MTAKPARLSILYLGDPAPGTTSLQRCEALRRLGHAVTFAEAFPRRMSLLQRADNWLYRAGVDGLGHHSPAVNRGVRRAAAAGGFDLLWIDKGVWITAATIEAAKAANPGMAVLGYSPDYMAARHNNSRCFIGHSRLYDGFATTKSYAVGWQQEQGSRNVLFVGNAYDPATHRPLRLGAAERGRIGGPVGFIGAHEADRGRAIAFLGAHGVPVRVYGGGPWDWPDVRMPGVEIVHRAVMGEDYVRAINSFDINLCFLRAMNLDAQTTRSVEIPACGAFMLAQRTAEHRALFKEGVEAEFFGDDAELRRKCRHYLARPALRRRVAAAGRRRCLRSGYSNQARLAWLLDRWVRAGGPGPEGRP